MNYVIFNKESGELVDIVDFSDVEKIKYEKANPENYLEPEDELLGELLEDDEYLDEFDDDYEEENLEL